jgi:hypothetical protein
MYQFIKNTFAVLRLRDNAQIPNDELNADWVEYKKWVEDGGITNPSPEDVILVPRSVTMRQARLALLAAGKLDDVEAAINALPEPPKTPALIEWNYSNEVLRHNGFVSQIAPLVGMTPADLDAIFIEAAKL